MSERQEMARTRAGPAGAFDADGFMLSDGMPLTLFWTIQNCGPNVHALVQRWGPLLWPAIVALLVWSSVRDKRTREDAKRAVASHAKCATTTRRCLKKGCSKSPAKSRRSLLQSAAVVSCREPRSSDWAVIHYEGECSDPGARENH